jgi:hypothetical protein
LCKPENGEAFKGRALDISVGGMFIESSTKPAFGTNITVELLIPGSKEKSALPGVVRWNHENGFGVQFGLLGARDTHAITLLLRPNL